MSRDDWLQWLDRALDGEELSEGQARALAEDLADSGHRQQAAAWLAFEAQLRGALDPASAEDVALSKERLLATAALREKHWQRERSSRRRRWALGGLAAAAVLVAAVIGALARRPNYPTPRADGDFRVVGQAAGLAVRRGDRVVAEGGGARLRLGGYCDLTLAPGTEVRVRGEARREAVELTRGEVAAAVTPKQGQFRVRTPLGALDVLGTEFTVRVEPIEPEQGERAMRKLKRMAVVTVMVVSGAVAFQMGERAGVLRAGMGEAFAGEEGGETGGPAALRGFRGILVGRVLAKSQRTLAITVKEVKRQWKQSRAERPEAAVGRALIVHVRKPTRLLERHLDTLRGLRAGDWVEVEVFEQEGALEVVELLRKIRAPERERDREKERPRRHEEEGEEGRRHPEKREKRREGERRDDEEAEALQRWLAGDEIEDRERGDRKGERHPEEAARDDREREGDRKGRRHPEEVERDGDREGEGDRPVEFPEWDEVGGEKKHPAPRDDKGEGERKRDREGDREGERGEAHRDIERKLEEGRAHHWRERDRKGKVREREREREGGEQERGAEERRRIKAVRGFRGVLIGTVRKRTEHGFVLDVDRVAKLFNGSRAEHPRALAGRRLRMTVRYKGRTNERLARALAQVHEGDHVAVGAIHLEGEVFAIVEGLKKVSADF
jgi:ferric-dicitrate binding protein FerR (iron transport regulator)